MKEYHHKLYPDHYYHIYNRANGNDSLFLTMNNYGFFLHKYLKYISPIAETICYCLMPNHFHFLIKIRDSKELLHYSEIAVSKSNSLENVLSQQFSHYFNSYAQAYNKQQNRKGSLFMKNFNKILVKDDIYLRKLILYIHKNPIESGIVESIDEWKYSSYFNLINNINDSICSRIAISYFEDLKNFIYCHNS